MVGKSGLGLGMIILCIAGCAQTTVGSSASRTTGEKPPATSKSEVAPTASAASASWAAQPIAFTEVKSTESQSFDGAYWRMFVTLGDTQNNVLAEADIRRAHEILIDKLKAVFWRSGQELLITVRPRINGAVENSPVVIVHLKSDGSQTSASNALTDQVAQRFLNPARKAPQLVEVQIGVVRINSNQTEAFKALGSFVGEAAPFVSLLSGGIPLTAAKKDDLKAKGQHVDTVLTNLFSVSNTPPPTARAFNPMPTAGNPEWTKELHVHLGTRDLPDARLFTLKNLRIESILGDGNRLSGIPAESASIKGIEFIRGGGEPTTLREVIRLDIRELHEAMLIGTAAKIQDFCKDADEFLAQRLGLEKFDRTAVIWAYLMDSPWSRRGEFRPANESDDLCINALRLAGMEPLSQLKVPASLQPEFGEQRRKVWESSKIYREGAAAKQGGLIPTAILSKDAAKWREMFGEKVRLTSVRRAVNLPDRELAAGDSVNRDGAVIADWLNNASLIWIPSEAGKKSCFSRADDLTTRRAFVAEGHCMQLRRSDGGTEDLPTEFVVNESSQNSIPKIIEVRFYPD